jgi:hypothetical protein
MQLLKTIRIITTFYKSFLLASLLVTACCLGLFWKYGFSIFTAIFWLKITTLAITYYFITSYKSKEFYYYQNLGISKVLLWCTTLIFDFAFFIFLVTAMYKFK